MRKKPTSLSKPGVSTESHTTITKRKMVSDTGGTAKKTKLRGLPLPDLDRDEITRLIIAALADLGYPDESKQLELETGLCAVSPHYQKVEDLVHQRKWNKVLEPLSLLEFRNRESETKSFELIARQWIAQLVSKNQLEEAVRCIQTEIRAKCPRIAQELTWYLLEPNKLLEPSLVMQMIFQWCGPGTTVGAHRFKQLIKYAEQYEELVVPIAERRVVGKNKDLQTLVVHLLKIMGKTAFAAALSDKMDIHLQTAGAAKLEKYVSTHQWTKALRLVNLPQTESPFANPAHKAKAESLVLLYAVDDLVDESPREAIELARRFSGKGKQQEIGVSLITRGKQLHVRDLKLELQSLSNQTTPSEPFFIYLFDCALKYQAMVDSFWCKDLKSETGTGPSLLNDLSLLSKMEYLPTKCAQTLHHDDEVWELAISPNAEFIASGTRAGTLYIWQRLKSSQGYIPYAQFKGHHSDGVQSIDWSHDGTKVLSGGGDGYICIVDVKSVQVTLCQICGESDDAKVKADIAAVCWVKDDTGFFTGSYDGKLIKWSADGAIEWVYKQEIRVLSMSIYDDGAKLVVLSVQLREDPTSHTLMVFDIQKNNFVDERKIYTALTSLAVSEFTGHFALNAQPNGVRLWSSRHEGDEAISFEGPVQTELKIRGTFGGPFDKFFASGSEDRKVRIFNRYTKKLVDVLVGHTAVVNTVKWASTEPIIATASDDRNVKIWRPRK